MLNRLITPVMLLSGVLTLTMLLPSFPPALAGRAMFDGLVADGIAPVVFSNWRILIGASGALLIAGALFQPLRVPALIFAMLSKAGFIALVITRGYLESLGQAVAVDGVMIVLFAAFLVAGAKRV
ncbi:MAG TPA: hypothetical protein PLK37_05095 [Terricaulis sp.]|nr:hypothetical protein [Terricaulis sp.]